MSKRDDDSGVTPSGDMEVGMTTAERRRRRRRGGGLRVPSDNVPRRTNPPVVAPVPEDPSLAMSIAYSFSSEGSEPVPRVTVETPVPTFDAVAPEAMPTVIDPPSAQVESADFEMKTREMSAVDLEALGLTEPGTTAPPADAGLPGMVEVRFKKRESDVEIDVAGLEGTPAPDPSDEPTTIGGPPSKEQEVRTRKERLKTVALSEDDLEEVREAVRAVSSPPAAKSVELPRTTTPTSTPPPFKADTTRPSAPPVKQADPSRPSMQTQQTQPLAKTEITSPSAPPSMVTAKPTDAASNRTQPLTPMDIEVDRGNEEPMSVPEIDIQELSDRAAETSGEFEVDVDEVLEKSGPIAAAAEPVVDPKRGRPASTPPPLAPSAATTHPGVPPPPASSHPPPPPPAAHHKAPPTPPPAAKPKPSDKAPSAVSSSGAKLDPKGQRGKPWFVDLFDEDYLRTLPFLTPQATQAEAEFVIDAMGLSPGAQVLDVGCGYGRHAMELAARGFHVVGLDISTPLLVRGGEEAHRRGLQINFVRGDMRELDFEAQFEGAYCLFSTFGYFDDETNKKTVANIARALKPGGRVLLEILNRDYVIADLPTRVWWEGEGCVVLEEVELNYFSSRIQVNRSVVFDDGRQLEQEISVRAYSLHEVGKLMHAAGFRVLEVSGGYQTRGRFFGNQSRHIIVLAERKDTATS